MRVRRECEELRALCRRQMKMVDEQREFLRNLNNHHACALGENLTREGAGPLSREDIDGGE